MMAVMGFVERMWGTVMVMDNRRIRQGFETWKMTCFPIYAFNSYIYIYIFS